MEEQENKFEEVAEEIKAEAAEGKTAFEEKKAEILDKAEELRDKIADKADELKEEFQEKKDDFKDDFQEKKEELKEKAAETKEKIKEKINEMEAESAAADADATYTDDEVNNGKLMGILAYLGVLNLIPFLVEKENKFARFHTVQGFTLLVVWLILFILDVITGRFLNFVFDTLEFLVGIWAIIGIVNVIKGEAKELPLIGKYRFIK